MAAGTSEEDRGARRDSTPQTAWPQGQRGSPPVQDKVQKAQIQTAFSDSRFLTGDLPTETLPS